ncbi:MAG: DUF1073 domain-containing protein [Deltaproteobacteria bacterium]|nr:DUF1073 domain-containing protein [Deltaproteobacteria bacterium]
MGKKLTAKQKRYFSIQDGWSNLLAGFGKQQDKTMHTMPTTEVLIPAPYLTNIWYGDGLGTKVVKVVADDMTRAGFTVKEDDDNKILDKLRTLEINNLSTEAMYWARLYGGALIVADIENSGDLEQPVPTTAGEVVKLRVYDKTMVRIETRHLYGEDSPNMGEPEIFMVTPPGDLGQGQFPVHESRCAWIKGEPLPKNAFGRENIDDRFWGASALQVLIDDVKNLGTTHQGLANLMMELSIGKLKLGNMAELLAENNSKKFYDRMEIINMQKSLINMLLLGQDEEFTREHARMAGISEVVDKMYMRLQASSNIPKTKLTGEQQSGLSNNDNSSLQSYYTDVETKQLRQLFKPLSRLAHLVNYDEDVFSDDDIPIIEFNPVWEPTAAQKVELMEKWANAMEKFYDMGVLSPEEIRLSTFGSGRTVFNITLLESEESNLKQSTNGNDDKE